MGMISIIIISDEDEKRAWGIGRKEREGLRDKRAREIVDEDELGLTVAQEYGDSASVETGVDAVEDGTGHGDGELKLVHGGDVGGHNGHHLTPLDAERYD
ncbi:hypothetical protein F2P56_000155 [Juglans regia]|uniref:Uncharacterized protein n=1 Tax=Juglans regia TaxID=51240 RepID=A0A833YA96_JUGRE|nr:hypothetical protein F2P56_000155 [Juglans regia]